MKEQTITHVTYGPFTYGVTYAGDKIGVVRGTSGKVKYMPVVFSYGAHYWPRLLKTRLALAGTAEELVNNLCLAAKIKSDMGAAAQICEHILTYGRTPR